MSIESLRPRLESIGQGHVFRFYDQLDDAGKQQLEAQLAAELTALDAKRALTVTWEPVALVDVTVVAR